MYTFVCENVLTMGYKQLLLVLLTQSFLISGLSAQQTTSPCPCCEEPYRQFDFWLGDWIVYSKGKMAGFNKITKIEGGCILRENWKSVDSGYTGTSYNFYDQSVKKWKQVWIDNQGSVLELSGELVRNQMTLVSQPRKDKTGRTVINRIIWTNNTDGTVKQLWEVSEDGGISFSPIFEGLYRKRS
jgi:hypothetical protein